MRRTLWVIFGLIILVVVTAAAVSACTGTGRTLNADASYSGKTVELSLGDSLIVTLASDATTGYGWTSPVISNEMVLRKTMYEYIGEVGLGGKEVWTFKTLQKGICNIQTAYTRTGERDVPPVQTFHLKVVVN